MCILCVHRFRDWPNTKRISKVCWTRPDRNMEEAPNTTICAWRTAPSNKWVSLLILFYTFFSDFIIIFFFFRRFLSHLLRILFIHSPSVGVNPDAFFVEYVAVYFADANDYIDKQTVVIVHECYYIGLGDPLSSRSTLQPPYHIITIHKEGDTLFLSPSMRKNKIKKIHRFPLSIIMASYCVDLWTDMRARQLLW